MQKDPLTEDSRQTGDNVGAPRESIVGTRTPIVVMGPAGSGKTTLGQRLAQALGRPFVDADDHHCQSSVEKMQVGQSLNDHDRRPWLLRLRKILAQEPPPVLACSALKRSYRTLLRPEGVDVVFLLLDVPQAKLAQRLAARTGHYAGPTLLASQLATLEPPSGEAGSFVIDASGPVETVFDRALTTLGLSPQQNET